MKSYKKPTSKQVEAAIPLLSSPQHEAYFFEQLENPHWITPLQKLGMFAHSPKVEDVRGGGIRFPIWPASKYLARMAKHVPSEVAEIFENLETDNESVIGDMLGATLGMPARVAATLVPVISRAIQRGGHWLQFKDASDLCVLLSNSGETHAAMTLAETLFTPRFGKGQEYPNRQDDYSYKDGLKKVVPALVEREPRKFLPKLCEWLKDFVDAKHHVNPDSDSDYSYMWRPAVEEHEQNHDYDIAGAMVGFVKQGFEQAIRDGKLPLEEALKIIDRYPYLIFRRIRIYLINEFAEQSPELARQVMMDRDLLDNHQYKHEYAMLVGKRLDLLTTEEWKTWFRWIDEGPDMSGFDDRVQENKERKATDEDRQIRKQYWQFEKWHCVREHLENKRRIFYEEMLAKHGEPELADLNIHSGSVRWGHNSPMTVDDLVGMTFEEAVEKVSSWEPGEPGERGLMEPNKEGLASTFGEYVSTNPEAFSAQASVLKDRPEIYVREFIRQMAEAIKTNREIDVSAVLELCRWVLGKRTTSEQGNEELYDEGWQRTREPISRFIQNTCMAMVENTPKYPLEEIREPIWNAISLMCGDRVESNIVYDISQDDPRVKDYLTLGINSPRGRAVEAALEYARWIANHIKSKDGKHEIVLGGFETMREVREMLEWQITPDNWSFEVMTVIGSRINLIYWIDKDWLASNANNLFNLDGIEKSPPMAQGWAAWNAFLIWVRPHIDYYKMFKKQYAYAVEQSVRVDIVEQNHEQPMNHLGKHLMIFYGHGQLELDDDEGLMIRFLGNSHPDIRRHAIGFVGQTLAGDKQALEVFVSRFKALWEVYWLGAGKRDAEEKPEALLFGTWFSSGQFPEQWALEQLKDYVEVTKTPEPDHSIVEQLAKIAHVDIRIAVHVLDQMVRGDREGWRIHGWIDPARMILEVALKTGGDPRTQAEQIINHLGRRGHAGFGELLDLNGTPNTQ